MKTLKKGIAIAVLTLAAVAFVGSTTTNVEAASTTKLNKTSVSLKAGSKTTLKATVKGKAAKKVTWKTSNKSIATVSNKGVVVGKKAGTTKVTAKVNGKKVTCKVKVSAAAKKTQTNTNTNTETKQVSALEKTAKSNMTKYMQFMNEVVKYTNEYRAKNGVKAVTMDNQLALVAAIRSAEMAEVDILSHTRPDGSKFYNLATQYGVTYTYIGENIGAYQMNAKEVVDAWYASPGHQKNMLNSKYSKIGVGVGMTSDGYLFWTQLFKN